jgi:DNA adenine methylase
MRLSPFLKWAGGKRWLIQAHSQLFDLQFDNYIEPFLGSGSVFFHMLPEKSILSDKNPHLIDTYKAIKKNWKLVYELLSEHSARHCHDYYYEMRALDLTDSYAKAAQLIYLNRTCWNGLYRVNKNGKFNVPKGSKDKVIYETDDFYNIAKALKKARLYNNDFEIIIDKANSNDLLFVDPPYTVNHNNNGFLKYNKSIFSWDDQIRLSKAVIRAQERGAKVILTNANHVAIQDLYRERFDIRPIPRASVLAGKAEYRGQVTELLVLG